MDDLRSALSKHQHDQRDRASLMVTSVGVDGPGLTSRIEALRSRYSDGRGLGATSRPHLANALAGRYALSEAKVESLRAFLAQPPPVVQPTLL